YYYATQVMHHFGGESWKAWNEKMREQLIKTQERTMPEHKGLDGSWSPVGEHHAAAGGRLMITSLSILTLEVYYRHLPLYYRDAGPAFTRLFDAHKVVCVCPQGGFCWWVDHVCPAFDPVLTPERHLLDNVLPYFGERWGLAPPALGVLGISMGGQGALRLAFK